MSNAFRPTGNTVLITATTAGASDVVPNTTQGSEYMITNLSNTDTLWVAIGFGSAPTCTIPTAGNPGNAFPVLHDQPPLVISAWPGAYFTCKSATGSHNIAITPGEALK